MGDSKPVKRPTRSQGQVIGVTGHRYLPPDLVPGLEAGIRAFYEVAKQQHGVKGITVLSSLAEGADQICAKLALDVGLRLVVPLPLPALEYRKDFTGTAAAEFDCLLSLADDVFVVDAQEPLPGNLQRGFYYRQAGIYLARWCDVLLAVWNGIQLDSPDGAGTWETIKLAKRFEKPVHTVSV